MQEHDVGAWLTSLVASFLFSIWEMPSAWTIAGRKAKCSIYGRRKRSAAEGGACQCRALVYEWQGIILGRIVDPAAFIKRGHSRCAYTMTATRTSV